MSLQNRLSELRRRHRTVDRELQELRGHPSVTDDRLHQLKRLKLNLKDEIAAIERGGYREAA